MEHQTKREGCHLAAAILQMFRISVLIAAFPILALADEWREIFPTNPPSGRGGHSMVPLGDGRILLFGGVDDSGVRDDIHLFQNGEWSPVVTTNFPPARRNHVAWRLNNKMYIHGGLDRGTNYLDDIWQYDPLPSGSNTDWQAVGVSTAMGARAYHTAIPLTNGDVLFTGGRDGTEVWPRDAWVWRGTNAWEEVAAPPSSWAGHTAQPLSNGDVVGLGWNSNRKVMTYTPGSNTWTEVTNGPVLAAFASSVVVPDEGGREKLVVFGGYDSNYVQSDLVYDYRPAGPQMVATNYPRSERMPQGLSQPASAPLPRTTTTVDVVVFGGYTTNHTKASNTYIASFPAAPRPARIIDPVGGSSPSFEFDLEPGYQYQVRRTPSLQNPVWGVETNYLGAGQRETHYTLGAGYYQIGAGTNDW